MVYLFIYSFYSIQLYWLLIQISAVHKILLQKWDPTQKVVVNNQPVRSMFDIKYK